MKGKKLIAATVCACLAAGSVFGFAACNKNSMAIIDDLKFDAYGDPIFTEDINNPMELKVWTIIGEPDNEYFDVINKSFNDYYRENGLKATVASISNGDFYNQFAQTISSDPENAPDVVVFHSERLPDLVNTNSIRSFDDFFAALGNNNTFSKDNYYANVMDECVYDGKVYGVPLDVHSGMWYVRSDILEKNGLEVPTSLSELVSCCNQLITLYSEGNLWYRAMSSGSAEQCAWKKSKDFGSEYNPIVMYHSNDSMEAGWLPQCAALQNGASLSLDNEYPGWNTDGMKNAMQMFRDWQTGENGFKGTPYAGKFVSDNNSAQTVWSSLASGKAVFSFEGNWWAEQRLNEYEQILGSLEDGNGKTYQPLTLLSPSKLFALDETKDYASSVYGVGHCFAISRTVTSKTKCVAASLYAQYMTEHSAEYMQGGHLPANKAVYESEKFKSLPCYERYLKQMGKPEDFVMLGGTKYYSEVYGGMKQLYDDVLNPAKRSRTISDLLTTNYNSAVQKIDALQQNRYD